MKKKYENRHTALAATKGIRVSAAEVAVLACKLTGQKKKKKVIKCVVVKLMQENQNACQLSKILCRASCMNVNPVIQVCERSNLL